LWLVWSTVFNKIKQTKRYSGEIHFGKAALAAYLTRDFAVVSAELATEQPDSLRCTQRQLERFTDRTRGFVFAYQTKALHEVEGIDRVAFLRETMNGLGVPVALVLPEDLADIRAPQSQPNDGEQQWQELSRAASSDARAAVVA
jgi:hypothetical protein